MLDASAGRAPANHGFGADRCAMLRHRRRGNCTVCHWPGADARGLKRLFVFVAMRPALTDGNRHQGHAAPLNDAMTVEIMTPHARGYCVGNESPHETGQPTPISFFARPVSATFGLVLRVDRRLVPGAESDALHDWKALVWRMATHAFVWLSFGAKNAVGLRCDGGVTPRLRAGLARVLQPHRLARQKSGAEAQVTDALTRLDGQARSAPWTPGASPTKGLGRLAENASRPCWLPPASQRRAAMI